MVLSVPTKTFKFCKYHGAGNDFILIDNRSGAFEASAKEISLYCHRRFGIGADGVILLERSQGSDFAMRIYNADGFEAAMCGNGVRCLASFIRKLGATDKETFTLATMHRQLTVTYKGSQVEVQMGAPTDIRQEAEFTIMNTGVPHAILFKENIQEIDLLKVAPSIRYHDRFAPQGVNVNFVEKRGPQTLAIRTYERGVEGETLACGTGCTAAALAAHLAFAMPSPIAVETASKEVVTISFNPDFHDVRMAGEATLVFEGIYE